jgi:hypothetical protein
MRSRRENFQRVAVAIRNDLDRAVIAITCIADDTVGSRLLGRGGAKKYALHATANNHP